MKRIHCLVSKEIKIKKKSDTGWTRTLNLDPKKMKGCGRGEGWEGAYLARELRVGGRVRRFNMMSSIVEASFLRALW